MRASIVLIGIGVVLSGVSCKATWTGPYADHCANQEGDEWCAAEYPDGSRPFCSRGIVGCEEEMDRVSEARDGCVPSRPLADVCYSPCGGRSDVTEDPTCLGGVSSSSGNETSTGATDSSGSESVGESSTTGPTPCMENEDCTEDVAPFCEPVSGECVACEGTADPDGACAGLDPMLPLCVGGACVQCTAAAPQACTGATPICDDATNTCVPCTAHDQCGEAACNLFTGACLPAEAVAHVGPGQPFAELAAAVGNFAGGAEGTIVIHQDNYDEAVTVDEGRTLAFLAADGDLPLWILAGGGMPQLTVSAGSALLMDGMQLSSNANDVGLHVDGGLAWVDRSRIVQNSGGGVVVENGAELVLRNCFVGGADNAAAVDVNASTARVTFSTLGGGTITATGLSCTAPDMVEVRSSIIVALGIMATGGVDVACSVAEITYTATEAPFAGTGNVAVGELPFMTPGDWFAGYGTGDYHLQNDGLDLFADVAQWQAGDPTTDIDGDPRPAVDGTADYAGADVP